MRKLPLVTDTPINCDIVKKILHDSKTRNVGKATIREVKRISEQIEAATGETFIHMELGLPGLPPPEIAVNGEIEALRRGVASVYPDVDGVPALKKEISRFVKSFIDIDVSPECCIPTVGSMQASFVAFMTVNRMYREREGTLFIDPGFSLHRQQLRILGQEWESFDVYDYRGEKLRHKLEPYLKTGKVSSILYTNPNNPAWICFTENELRIIGELATQYNVILLEDLAYFAMDFRKDYSKPGVPPFQPSVAKYTDNYILFISGSKSFSYAGQRVSMMVISDKVFHTHACDLLRYYNSDMLGHALIYGGLYAASAGVTHSAQYGLAALLKAASDGTYNFIEPLKLYGEKAKALKKLFTDNGFRIVYDKDENESIADGFYFTVSFPGFTGEELVHDLIYYGIATTSLNNTGSRHKEGIRICVSFVKPEQYPMLEARLKKFYEHYRGFVK